MLKLILVNLFVPLLVFVLLRGKSWVKSGFSSFGAKTGIVGTIHRTYVALCFYWYVFSLAILLFLPLCLLLYLQVKFYSCFFVQYLFVLYVSLCVSFARL